MAAFIRFAATAAAAAALGFAPVALADAPAHRMQMNGTACSCATGKHAQVGEQPATRVAPSSPASASSSEFVKQVWSSP
jgi:hypothetical protein